ncbi:MAG: hypothetical protein ACHP7M_10135 [Burkholderiales bacterium]
MRPARQEGDGASIRGGARPALARHSTLSPTPEASGRTLSAIRAYSGNILLLGLLLSWTWGHATCAWLIKDDTPPDVVAAICRRIVIAQSLYALAPPWPFGRRPA